MARDRRGVALLSALALLALSAALATVTFSAAVAARRASVTAQARALVETGGRRAFGEVIATWSAALDSMPVGTGADIALAERVDPGPPLVRRARVEHVADGLYAVTVELRAFSWAQPVARRRVRLWLERPAATASSPGTDVTRMTPPILVTHWPFADLY